MAHLPHLTTRLATMCTAYEYLATMSMIAQRNSNLFSKGGELYWPHETLNTGYTQAGLRRISMSHSDFMDLIDELQKKTRGVV